MKQPEEKTTFLKRWSDRKQEARQEETAQPAAADRPGVEEAAIKTDADMPPLDSLNHDSDYSGFLSPGVSDALRKAALRKLFHMPHLNVVDGLDDYAEDFTSFEALGDVVTQYDRYMAQVKEKRRQEEEEQQRLAEEDFQDALPDEQSLLTEQSGTETGVENTEQEITMENMQSVNEQQHS